MKTGEHLSCTLPSFFLTVHVIFSKCRYHVRYDDGEEEEDLTWNEIVPLLPAREASERVMKKSKQSCWLRDEDGKLTPWAKHPDGGNWDSVCCWPDCEGGRYVFVFFKQYLRHS
jgi:hypothetical protein